MAEPLEALLKRKPKPKMDDQAHRWRWLDAETDFTTRLVGRKDIATVVEKVKGPQNTGYTTALRGKKCGIKFEGRRESGCRKPKLQGGEGNGKEGWYLISYKEEDGK